MDQMEMIVSPDSPRVDKNEKHVALRGCYEGACRGQECCVEGSYDDDGYDTEKQGPQPLICKPQSSEAMIRTNPFASPRSRLAAAIFMLLFVVLRAVDPTADRQKPSSCQYFGPRWKPPNNCPRELVDSTQNIRSNIEETPCDANFAIAIIALGDVVNTSIVERSVQSIRRRGRFCGRILLVTDAHHHRFADFAKGDGNLSPVHVKFARKHHDRAMHAKRFKTEILNLMDEDETMQDYTHALYMDVDIVIGDRLENFIEYVKSMTTLLSEPKPMYESFMLMFEEQGHGKEKAVHGDEGNTIFHGGVIALHREYSRGCLNLWQEMFDSKLYKRDQTALYHMLYEDKSLRQRCEVIRMDHRPYLTMPTEKSMTEGETSVFVHVTNGRRAKNIDEAVQRDFFRCVIMIDDELAVKDRFDTHSKIKG